MWIMEYVIDILYKSVKINKNSYLPARGKNYLKFCSSSMNFNGFYEFYSICIIHENNLYS